MDRAEAFSKLAGIAAETLGVDAAVITEATTFDDLEADSLSKLDLVMSLEDEFGVTLPDEVLETIESMADALDALAAATA